MEGEAEAERKRELVEGGHVEGDLRCLMQCLRRGGEGGGLGSEGEGTTGQDKA